MGLRKYLPVIGLFLFTVAFGLGGCGSKREAALQASPVRVLTDGTFDEATARGVVLVEFWTPM